MPQHQVERLRSRLFAQLRQQSDISTKDGLQAGSDSPDNRARADNDSAHHPEGADHAKAAQFKLGGHHGLRDH